jgi:hypothetical protein
MTAVPARRESRRARDHRYDREIASATYKAQRAREGRGHTFRLPPSLRQKP